ncbi:MAG TPA: pyruvate:ferredoxin (flavodoxin) oxidoreductase [Candidatus Limnocylindria bacterium]|nr:pyruvate:ferredoxin (flavodoxin) oxidoreductase [Candidatus Limnocylindria bacterium]
MRAASALLPASERRWVMIDGNEAAATVAYLASEVIAIYPITPSSPMGELADAWAASGCPNLWGQVPRVVEMQSEGGAAGVLHGALTAGALGTTFTASQGLLLMIPDLYRIAGELSPMVMHVAARALAAQALSIFGDHSDVMAARATGVAMVASASVQEAMDLALVAHAATLASRVPFVHFFDGFRTSHEVARIQTLALDDVQALIDDQLVRGARARALAPEHPTLRGTAQNSDVYFQAREAANPFYLATPTLVQQTMDALAARVGRRYRLFDYDGAPDAERVVIAMGSGARTVRATAARLVAAGERVGCLTVRLFRPFSVHHFLAALPPSVRAVAVLDRTKEPGSAGEPLYLDVVAALAEGERSIRAIGGRYGLSSKEFTPAMAKAVFDALAAERPKNHFTVGIVDDVTHTSLPVARDFDLEEPDTVRAVFYGLGADGTVGANKSTIKIIGEHTDRAAQAYFVYDSKKAGSLTVSHLRFGRRPIEAPYLIEHASFVACHQFAFLECVDVLKVAESGATVLLNSPYGPDEVWSHLPRPVQEALLAKQLRLYVIDADRVAREAGMGSRINTVMQTCFFALAGVLPRDEAIAAIKRSIEKAYGTRGHSLVEKNWAAVDRALDALAPVSLPAEVSSTVGMRETIPDTAPTFVRTVTRELLAGRGDELPVSALPPDGAFPTGTARWEKRRIADAIPVWDADLCIQCGKCVLVCPHAVIRAKVVSPADEAGAPAGWRSVPARWRDMPGQRYVLQVAPDDCTGCALCVEICPVKNKAETRLKAINMQPALPLRETEAAKWDFFLGLPDPARPPLHLHQVKDVQLLPPLFEFSGACAGCGETPYLKLVSQLFGDRALIANATGCSSIYGGNLPTTPWTTNAQGHGPAWSNSLFEDNAEFGLGMRLARDHQRDYARALLERLADRLGEPLVRELLAADQTTDAGVAAQRARVAALRERLALIDDPAAAELAAVADALVRVSVWIVGGDGWAYDIGYGGLDHVLASGADVNVLVLDTEVYSNTGGQMSKATPRGAVAKFAAGGKPVAKKDLALLMTTYGTVYVATVAMGANDMQTLRAIREAESYDGPSLVVAYSHCIAHGYDLVHGLRQQAGVVASGAWPLFRFDPRRAREGKNPFQLDSEPPSLPFKQYAYNETRYTILASADPAAAKAALAAAEADIRRRWQMVEQLAGRTGGAA